ncbi:hypothetical protein H9P43_001445 [Blastocladiella emersonii ATCC 22665]|nr:hypothetical protein H9P43_001445 [Blastocladiella emersonii ATCC 22665]
MATTPKPSATMTSGNKSSGSRRTLIAVVVVVVLAAAAAGIYFGVVKPKSADSSATNGRSSSSSPTPVPGAPTTSPSGNGQPATPVAPPTVNFPISSPISVPMTGLPLKKFGNGVVWGSHIWGDNYVWAPTVAEISRRYGSVPGALGGFYHTDAATGIQYPDAFLDQARQARAAGTWFYVTLEPRAVGLNVTADTLAKCVELLRKASVEIGAPVLLRWAHEMNGNWYPWSQQPIKYKQVWMQLRDMLKKAAPKVAMVWSPNIGFPAEIKFTAPGSPEYLAMDTDKNGKVDELDDPYEPFFPGAANVDFISVSMFWFGNEYPNFKNQMPPADHVAKKLREPHDLTRFYRDSKLPFIISETASTFFRDARAAGVDEVAMKQTWWRQLIAEDPTMVMWFEFTKQEDNYLKDSCITNNTAVINAFKDDMKTRPLVFGPPAA